MEGAQTAAPEATAVPEPPEQEPPVPVGKKPEDSETAVEGGGEAAPANLDPTDRDAESADGTEAAGADADSAESGALPESGDAKNVGDQVMGEDTHTAEDEVPAKASEDDDEPPPLAPATGDEDEDEDEDVKPRIEDTSMTPDEIAHKMTVRLPRKPSRAPVHLSLSFYVSACPFQKQWVSDLEKRPPADRAAMVEGLLADNKVRKDSLAKLA